MTTQPVTAATRIRSLFNGPLLAGIGATTDAGLSKDMYHRVPWDPKKTTKVTIKETDVKTGFTWSRKVKWVDLNDKMALQLAKYNVDIVYNAMSKWDGIAAMSETYKSTLRRDMISILYVAFSYNYLLHETTMMTREEGQTARDLDADDLDEYVNVNTLNRAATWIMARMHTKYQTNHVLGGNPMQASMASVARALLGIQDIRTAENRNRYEATAAAMHWVLHPLNEQLLMPLAIRYTRMTEAEVPSGGPNPEPIELDEYFQIRATTPPASTHHFYVCSAAIRHLDPIGILAYIPNPSRMSDVRTGWVMIAAHGAALHPAARFWGLQRISANQKLVESLAADLGYAVRKIMPGSSLAASPILAKEDLLDSGWKTLIDSIRAAMDQRGQDLVDAGLLEDVKKAIAPTKGDITVVPDIKKLLTDRTAISQEEIDEYLKIMEHESESEGSEADFPADTPGAGPSGSGSADAGAEGFFHGSSAA